MVKMSKLAELRERRLALGITLQEIADYVKIDKDFLLMLECGNIFRKKYFNAYKDYIIGRSYPCNLF